MATASSSVYFSLGFLLALIDIILVLAPWAAKSGVGPVAGFGKGKYRFRLNKDV